MRPNEIGRPIALACLLACVALFASQAARAAGGDASAELAQRYAPVVRLVQQKEPCGHGEPYVPTNVGLVLGNADVALRGPWDRTNIIKVAPTAQDLSQGLFAYHLDFPGSAVTPGCTYDEWSHRINRGHTPTVYARVVEDPADPREVALQYWFFYVFNDFNDKHEGDWEMIQLDFDASSARQALRNTPALIGYSQHEGAESARWGDSKLEIVDATHPVVYAALGSHANYYTSALHLGRSAAEGLGCDDTSGPSTVIRPDVALIPTERPLQAYPWLGFQGHWGEEHQGFYDGPTGPNTKPQWKHPMQWANTAWRDKSFTVSVGTSVGETATAFFCGAVATGSSVLTALVSNPSPVYVGLVSVFALLLWLTSRTRWQPSAPLRLERRRPWGSIINASRRMYAGHVRLFLAIGLLFFPLGALITGVQYLLFHQSGLTGLLASAGRTNAFVDAVAVALGVAFTIFGYVVIQSVTAIAMVEIDAGREATAMAAYRKALPKVAPLLGVTLVMAAVMAIVELTAIATVLNAWLIVRWAFFAHVVALEDVPAHSSLHRSARLVRGNWWRTASLLLFVAVVALLLGPLCGTLLLFATDASFDFINLVSGVIYAIVLPFAAIATTYLYFDLRVVEQAEAETAGADLVLPAES